ncbi:hypothetical protein F5148DRAFT_1239478 [Russula earlei]|uniref:Uncharacterized protein n=1 Tax=Russula earlei TaxID=71964 RepID=A0ACC0TYG7_9AGAM|nr:hypothetical protein F5148DRAFT_1239478 [Russula earlei]
MYFRFAHHHRLTCKNSITPLGFRLCRLATGVSLQLSRLSVSSVWRCDGDTKGFLVCNCRPTPRVLCAPHLAHTVCTFLCITMPSRSRSRISDLDFKSTTSPWHLYGYYNGIITCPYPLPSKQRLSRQFDFRFCETYTPVLTPTHSIDRASTCERPTSIPALRAPVLKADTD